MELGSGPEESQLTSSPVSQGSLGIGGVGVPCSLESQAQKACFCACGGVWRVPPWQDSFLLCGAYCLQQREEIWEVPQVLLVQEQADIAWLPASWLLAPALPSLSSQAVFSYGWNGVVFSSIITYLCVQLVRGNEILKKSKCPLPPWNDKAGALSQLSSLCGLLEICYKVVPPGGLVLYVLELLWGM